MKNRFRTLLTALFLPLLALLPALAHADAIGQLHSFLDETRSFRAEFRQAVTTRSAGRAQESSGVLAIQRPGRLRWEILKPFPQLVVGDGQKIWIYDPELEQVTVREAGQAIGGSPAALLAGSKALDTGFTLRADGQRDGLDWVEAIPKTSDSGFEKVRIGMSGKELRAMELFDNFGQTTRIRFQAAEYNPSLPASLFRFSPPAGADVIAQ